MLSRILKYKSSVFILSAFAAIQAKVAFQEKLFETKILNLNRTQLTLNIDNPDVYYVSLYNVNGKKIRSLSQSYLSEGVQNLSFRGHGLPTGVYFVGLRSRTNKTVEKFILK